MMQLSMFVVVVLLLGATTRSTADEDDSNDHKFDVLIFTQQWPVTTCIEWKDQNPQHSCLLPSPKEMWTIHGVWPTLLGTIGPSFCNKTAEFDPSQLAPFEDQLKQFWTNVEKGQQLWKHEWLKHGTCASVLPELANENLYFNRGLTWLHKYSMSSILSSAAIRPDSAPTVDAVHAAVTSALNKRPYIRCLRDRQTASTYLSEIRICFAKNMTLIDCDGVRLYDDQQIDDNRSGQRSLSSLNTNCPSGEPIEYPSVVPPTRLLAAERPAVRDERAEWRFPWVDVYKLLNLIKMATL